MDYYAIGQRVRKFRKALGFSQEQLAEKVGISTTHMSHIETGNTKLSLNVLVLLACALEVRTDDLLFDQVATGHGSTTEEITAILKDCTTQQLQFIKELTHTAQVSIRKYLEEN